MNSPLSVGAAAGHASAIRAISELLEKLRLPHAFVGNVALSAWLGTRVESGAVDVLALLTPERMRQVPMMAGHHGFAVDPREIERAEELDLIPLSYQAVPIHVLMATNALYGNMLSAGVGAELDGFPMKVVRVEDLGLLLLMADEDHLLRQLIEQRPEFDLDALNRRLSAIGLGSRMIER